MVSVPSQSVDRRHYSRVLGVQASLTPGFVSAAHGVGALVDGTVSCLPCQLWYPHLYVDCSRVAENFKKEIFG